VPSRIATSGTRSHRLRTWAARADNSANKGIATSQAGDVRAETAYAIRDKRYLDASWLAEDDGAGTDPAGIARAIIDDVQSALEGFAERVHLRQ
jgi:hypothetical protein